MFPVGVGERSLAIESRMEVRKRKIPVIPDRMPAVGFAGGASMPCVSVGGVGAGPGCIPESVTRGHGVTNKKFKYNKHKFLWKTNFNS